MIKITNCKILRDHKIVENDAVWIQGGKIIDPHKFFWHQKRLPDEVLDAGGLLVVPGFIETQINGKDPEATTWGKECQSGFIPQSLLGTERVRE